MDKNVALQKLSDDEEYPVVAELGRRVRQIRKDKCMTLTDLAEHSGVSRAMISKIERSEKTPTLGTIVKVAKGLEVTLSELLGSVSQGSIVTVCHAIDRVTFRDPDSGFEREVLSPTNAQEGIEIVCHRLPPGKSTGLLPPYSVPTRKYIIVQKGKLTADIDDCAYELDGGDTLCFDVTTDYSFTNVGTDLATYLVFIVRSF